MASRTGLPVRPLMFVLKYLVPALVLFLLLSMFYIPNVGRFSCSWMPWFIPEAQADSNECPGSLKDAWDNAQWAAERYKEIRDGHTTTGLYYDQAGQRHKIVSGDLKGEDAERAKQTLRRVGAATATDGSYPAAHHVEVKIAAMMREAGDKTGLVVINYDTGPCIGDRDRLEGLSCQEVLPMILAPGSTLRVWWNEGGTMRFNDFPGR